MVGDFYIYGTHTEHDDIFSSSESQFSFVVDEFQEINVPSFLLWLYPDKDREALICKIRTVTRPTDIGMAVRVYDKRRIRISVSGILNSIAPGKPANLSGKDLAENVRGISALFLIPDDKATLVRNAILKNNSESIDESYFELSAAQADSEVWVEATDGFQTAFRIFGFRVPIISPFREPKLIDLDIQNLFPKDSFRLMTPDGRYFFEHQGKRLYLHNVDKHPIEQYLGVDLIYNFLDERRAIFIQYKCQRSKGKYYPSSDGSHEDEVRRMEQIPGLSGCYNLENRKLVEARLCRCPVFIKLCAREIPEGHSVPTSAYFSLCVWKQLVTDHRGLSVKNQPHFNRDQFQDLVRCGLIGSTPDQTLQIEQHLITTANDPRLRLVFEEEAIRQGDKTR